MEPGIAFFPEFQYLRRIVGRTVIYADDLDLRNLLLHEDAGQRLRQVEPRIEDRHDDRNFWRTGPRQDKRVAPRPRPETGGIGRVRMPPPEMGVSARGPFPGLLSAGKMRYPHLVPGQCDLLLETVGAQLHVPARVKRRDCVFADKIQGILVAKPFRRFQHDGQKPVNDRLAAELLEVHDQNARVCVAAPVGEPPAGRPRKIFGLCRMNHVFRCGEIAAAEISGIQLAQIATYGNIHIKIDQLAVCRQDVGNKQSIAGGHRQSRHLLEFGESGTRQSVRHVDESNGYAFKPGISGGESLNRFGADA